MENLKILSKNISSLSLSEVTVYLQKIKYVHKFLQDWYIYGKGDPK